MFKKGEFIYLKQQILLFDISIETQTQTVASFSK